MHLYFVWRMDWLLTFFTSFLSAIIGICVFLYIRHKIRNFLKRNRDNV